MNKTDLWDRLGRTDPAHTKSFTRAGGFKGTAIKPMASYRRMTEEYGPCGVGWGMSAPVFDTVPGPEGEVLVFCIVSVWHGDRDNIVFGVGGDKVIVKQTSGLRSDDEAFKKAFTDAVTNALKLIGVGADVHMGLFDDSKYVNEVRREIAAQEAAEDEKEFEASRQLYIAKCKEKIAEFDDENKDNILQWWNSDNERKARRDFKLDDAVVKELKDLVIAKAKLPPLPKQAGA
jgi:hypothetical protein